MNKLDLLQATVLDLNPDVIGITESWANENISDAELKLNGGCCPSRRWIRGTHASVRHQCHYGCRAVVLYAACDGFVSQPVHPHDCRPKRARDVGTCSNLDVVSLHSAAAGAVV